MLEHQKLKLASALFRFCFPLYRQLYFRYKNKKDQSIISLLRKIAKPGCTAIDIGANVGFYARLLSDCAGPDGHVYAFEAEEKNFHRLKRELADRSNVSRIRKAVAAEEGELDLFLSPLLNVDHRSYHDPSSLQRQAVEKTSIDRFVSGAFPVDVIKMDIQGFEMEALKGMKNTLVENDQLVLLIELWPYGLAQAGSSAEQVFQFLQDLGFNIMRISSGGLETLTLDAVRKIPLEYFSDANIVCSRSSIIA